jgi:deoxyribodipyrimidine photo-lyase
VPVLPPPRSADVVEWVTRHLGHLSSDVPRASGIPGGQAAADAALTALDVTGYSKRRSQVLPVSARGATRLSPYIRHGLLTLSQVWQAAAPAAAGDLRKFRDELLWQEYARHLYARLGPELARSLRSQPSTTGTGDPWTRDMACMDVVMGELEADGWLVNQTRMWLASQWTVRGRRDWREGEDLMFRQLLDGSRAANRLGWQWTTGAGSGKPYGFSRWQVEKRAPALCGGCALRDACPVQQWPDATPAVAIDPPSRLGAGQTESGPEIALVTGDPERVWLTAESLGTEDPALLAHPDLPRVFVFDEPLLARLRLSGKRLVFLTQALAELDCEVRLGDPVHELSGTRLAVTYAPVPGFRTRAAQLNVVALHPWPWLRRPTTGSLRSWSAWVRTTG